MDIQRQAFQEWYIANHHDGDIHPNQQLLEWSEKAGFYFASSVEDLWEAWQAAKAQAVPDGFVLAEKSKTEHWYLDEGEGLYMDDPGYWLCDLDIGEVQAVEHKEYLVTESNTLYATKVWDDKNKDVDSWQFFTSKDEAEKAAAHCKAKFWEEEAQEQVG